MGRCGGIKYSVIDVKISDGFVYFGNDISEILI